MSERVNTSYELFIFVLTVISLVIMALSLLPLPAAVLELLVFCKNSLCVVFLIDFGANLLRAPTRRGYFIDQRGWLDLLGSLPRSAASASRGCCDWRASVVCRVLHG